MVFVWGPVPTQDNSAKEVPLSQVCEEWLRLLVGQKQNASHLAFLPCVMYENNEIVLYIEIHFI